MKALHQTSLKRQRQVATWCQTGSAFSRLQTEGMGDAPTGWMKMFRARLLVLLGMLTLPPLIRADDIVTISGKKYYDVHDVLIRDNLFTFTTATAIVRIPLSDIPAALKERYRPKATPPPPSVASEGSKAGAADDLDPKNPHDMVVQIANKYIQQIGEDMKTVRTTSPLLITPANAFSTDRIDAVRETAAKSGKAVAFFILDEQFLKSPADPNKPGAAGAFAQFFQTFNKSTIIVFVFPPGDLAKLPPAVADAVKKSAPVVAPRIVFTSTDTTRVIHELALTSEQLTVEEREKLVYSAVLAIKGWYVEIANSQ